MCFHIGFYYCIVLVRRLDKTGAADRGRGLPSAGGGARLPPPGLVFLHEGRMGAQKGVEDLPEDVRTHQGALHERNRT